MLVFQLQSFNNLSSLDFDFWSIKSFKAPKCVEYSCFSSSNKDNNIIIYVIAKKMILFSIEDSGG